MILLLVAAIVAPRLLNAQERGAAALAEARAGLGVHTRVLVIGAHPDDEDTQLITWLTRGNRAETAYLSLTRGDGGQNLIGNELGEELGVIRTQELLAARRIDGARQYFTRAYDFGFSKTAEESFAHWPRDSLLRDVVTVVRAFRPQIIVSVFSGTPRDGHGQHQVAGILARDAYDAAADTLRFPVARFGPAWTPLKFYRGARFSPGTATLSINVGEYDPVLGRSYAEIAAESRSQHKSQGFGSIQRKGVVMDYLRREDSRVNAATVPTAERSLFDGIDTARVVTADDRARLALLQSALAIEANADRETVAVGDSALVTFTAYNRGANPVIVATDSGDRTVAPDSSVLWTRFVKCERVSRPWWLITPRRGDLFTQPITAISEDERARQDWASVPVQLAGLPSRVTVRVPIVTRVADPVRGDVQRPLAVAPAFTLTLDRVTALARANKPLDRIVTVTVRSALNTSSSPTVTLTVPRGITLDSAQRTVQLAPQGTRSVTFRARGTLGAGTDSIFAIVTSAGASSSASSSIGYVPIEYDHIAPQRFYRPALETISTVDVALAPGLRIGYVSGVGDNVAPALGELGIPVTLIEPAEIPRAELSRFSTIVVGPRAYQASPVLRDNNPFLLRYVRAGGTLVVQYGQYEMQQAGMTPFAITLGRPAARVTDENAPVTLRANAQALLMPNVITQRDFLGWVQERSVYMPSTFDPRYETVLRTNDPGEPPNAAGILIAPYGRGRYVYTTLAFFRQIPQGVAGGVRLFANLLTPAR